MALARLIIILMCLATIVFLIFGLITEQKVWYRRAKHTIKILLIAALLFFGFLLLTKVI